MQNAKHNKSQDLSETPVNWTPLGVLLIVLLVVSMALPIFFLGMLLILGVGLVHWLFDRFWPFFPEE